MTRDEAHAVHRELQELMASGPGPVSEERRHQLQRLRFRFDRAPDQFGDMVAEACGWLAIWLSAEEWKQWGADRMRQIVFSAVYKAEMAIDREYPSERP